MRFVFSAFAAVPFLMGIALPALAYDPWSVSDAVSLPSYKDISFTDAKRKRAIPLRVYLPGSTKPAPVILFSHGLGGSRTGSAYLGKQWAARGYVVVYVQHPGSDDSVWRNTPPAQIRQAMTKAANAENFTLRTQDITATLDQLTAWNATKDHLLSGRLDMVHVGMSGHSFGAVTTQAVSGQSFGGKASATDKRIKAAVMFSPSEARSGGSNGAAFSAVSLPWLLMTGTKDTSPIGNTTAESRRKVYEALPPGDKYELVLNGAKHSAFGDNDRGDATPRYHQAIVALSTAFWDTYLRGDTDAKAWLTGAGAKAATNSGDVWQMK